MARGWESKSVESQQSGGSGPERGGALTREQRELKRKREGLDLSRRRVLHEMEETRSAARRAYLEQALAFLEEELAKLGVHSADP